MSKAINVKKSQAAAGGKSTAPANPPGSSDQAKSPVTVDQRPIDPDDPVGSSSSPDEKSESPDATTTDPNESQPAGGDTMARSGPNLDASQRGNPSAPTGPDQNLISGIAAAVLQALSAMSVQGVQGGLSLTSPSKNQGGERGQVSTASAAPSSGPADQYDVMLPRPGPISNSSAALAGFAAERPKSLWSCPAVPVISASADIEVRRRTLEAWNADLVLSFERANPQPTPLEIGAGLYRACINREGGLQESLWFQVLNHAQANGSGLTRPREITRVELDAMVQDALQPYLPTELSYVTYTKWVNMKQLDTPLREFGPRWLQAYSRVVQSDHKLRPREQYYQLEAALNRLIAAICFPLGCVEAADSNTPLGDIIARGIREEEAKREQQLISSAVGKSPARSDQSQSSSKDGNFKGRGGARKNQRFKAKQKAQSGSINYMSGGGYRDRTGSRSTCFLCGQKGHRFSLCSKFDEARLKAQRKGLDEIELPYRPQRETQYSSSSSRKPTSAVGSVNYSKTNAGGDDEGEESRTEGEEEAPSDSTSTSDDGESSQSSSRAPLKSALRKSPSSGSNGRRRKS